MVVTLAKNWLLAVWLHVGPPSDVLGLKKMKNKNLVKGCGQQNILFYFKYLVRKYI